MQRARCTGNRARRGVELTAALVSAFVVSVALLLAIQAYYHSGLALRRTTNRARAMMILESQAEVMRAAGLGALPKNGAHAFPAEALRGLPGATGALMVARGPARGMRTVRLEIEWPEAKGPQGAASLVFAVGPGGQES
jgi:hypothetical protein